MSDKVFRTCPITRLERFGRETVLWIQAPDIAAKAVAGQFVMVGLPRPRANFLKRAISIHAIDGAEVALAVLTVGDVSVALSRLTVGDPVEVIGPLGNGFDLDIQGLLVAMVAGGIGHAPFRFLAAALADQTKDITLYAGGRDRAALSGLGWADKMGLKTVLASEDGSIGQGGYVTTCSATCRLPRKCMFAGPCPCCALCRPWPWPAPFPASCRWKGRWPVGSGSAWAAPAPVLTRPRRMRKYVPMDRFFGRRRSSWMVDLRVDFCGLTFKNPVSTASGTYGFATEYGAFVPVDRLGSVTTKGLTLEPRQGNPGLRVTETPAGMLNCIGLENPGVDAFIRDILPQMRARLAWRRIRKSLPILAAIR